MPGGAILGGPGRVQAESTELGPGTHDFIKVERFGVPRLVLDSNQKEQGFGQDSWGSYLRGTQIVRPWETGENA